MTHTPEQVFARGKEALSGIINDRYEVMVKQLHHTREHYETGHNGEHAVTPDNDPMTSMYKILGMNMMDLQIFRQIDPDKFDRVEIVSWFMTALLMQTVPVDTHWDDFERGMLLGLGTFRDKQLAALDKPENDQLVRRTGMIVIEVEASRAQQP